MTKPLPLVKIPSNALIHKFGSSTPSSSTALLRFPEKGWTINRSQNEGWAIVGDAEGRRLAVETLLSRHRIHPIPGPPGPFPYIASMTNSDSRRSNRSTKSMTNDISDYRPIRHLAFSRPISNGEFQDYTARYGALQEEDKLTFRQVIESNQNITNQSSTQDVQRICELMNIDRLLDLPLISLSSGQTRKSRIASALLTKPLLLILEDPMSGLDVTSRKEVSDLLGKFNNSEDSQLKIILVLRGKHNSEDLPEWITNVAQVKGGNVWIGPKNQYQEVLKQEEESGSASSEAKLEEITENKDNDNRQELVKLDKVSVSYGEGTRPVLKEVSWTIKEGEKWHLQGSNGSGKTTLLSIILGNHPRSYSLPFSSLKLFDKPRREIPTSTLRRLIGHTSPEIYSSFPRSMGLTAYSTIGTGFEGVFSRRQLNSEQKQRVLYLIDQVKDLLKSPPPSTVPRSPEKNESKNESLKKMNVVLDEELKTIALKEFSHFTPSQQGLLLFLRAIVSQPNLLILDEPSQGIDENIWERCKNILKTESRLNERMSIIVVSHYEDEVPWPKGQGKILRLDQGVAKVE